MTGPQAPPDVEELVVAHLKADGTVNGLAAGGIGTELPAGLTLPRLTAELLPGSVIDADTAHLWRLPIQISGWAPRTGKAAALELANEGLRSMLELPEVAHPLGVVTAARVELSTWWNPDIDTDLARYQATIGVFAHRHPAAGS